MADKYDYLRVVGNGSFGKAWLVQSKASQRQYVLKEIKVSEMGEKDRHQAVNEVAILARLKHKNVVRYREAFVSAGTLSIVMAYADGGDLGHQIQQAKGVTGGCDKLLPETKIMRWFVQITFGLIYIHSLKILHRDLKPQNIFLTHADVIKIGDFGIARTLKNSLDRASTAIGTPYYLSPEICRRQSYDQKSDMWAAGCVLYELLSLNHPFEAEDFSFLVLQILRGKYKSIPSVYGPLPGDLVSVLLRVNPERRPSAEQILSIPSIRQYVDEYTSRVSKPVSSTLSSVTSGTPAPVTRQDNQPRELKSVESKSNGKQMQQKEGTPMASTEDNEIKPSDISVCSATPLAVPGSTYKQSGVAIPNCTGVSGHYGEVPKEGSLLEVKQSNLRAVESVDSNHDNYAAFQSKVCRRRAKSADRKTPIQEITDHSCNTVYSTVSQKSVNAKRESATVRSKEVSCTNHVAQRKLAKRCDEEGFRTIKRRKYSCMTPVAPKIIQGLGTPRSEKLRNGTRPPRKQSVSTPPVIRLFGKQQRGNRIAVKDGWSPDVSPRWQTRVLNKAFVSKTDNVGDDLDVKEKPPKVEVEICRNSVQDAKDTTKCSGEQPTDHPEQSNHLNSCKRETTSLSNHHPKLKADGVDDTGILQAGETSIAVKPIPHQSTSCPIDANNERQREVCEMLLACSRSNSDSSADIQAKIELLKMFLERRLGTQNAVMAYDLIAGMAIGDGKQADEIMQELQCVLPQNFTMYLPLLIHVKSYEE